MVGGIGVRGHPRPLVSIWFPPLPRSIRPPSGISHAPHPWQRSRIGIAPPDRQGICGQGCPRTRRGRTHSCGNPVVRKRDPRSGVGREWQSKASRINVERRYLPESFQASTKRCNGPVASEHRNQAAWGAKRGVGLPGMPGTQAKRILIRGDGEWLGCRSRTVQSPGDQLHEVGYVRLVQARR